MRPKRRLSSPRSPDSPRIQRQRIGLVRCDRAPIAKRKSARRPRFFDLSQRMSLRPDEMNAAHAPIPATHSKAPRRSGSGGKTVMANTAKRRGSRTIHTGYRRRPQRYQDRKKPAARSTGDDAEMNSRHRLAIRRVDIVDVGSMNQEFDSVSSPSHSQQYFVAAAISRHR